MPARGARPPPDTGDQWVMSGERPDGLEPEYICRLWVQKTLLAWQDPADEDGKEGTTKEAGY